MLFKEYAFFYIKALGVLGLLQIKAMLGYTDSWSPRTLIGQTICMFYCPCPVIGQEARDEKIAAIL